MQARKVNQRSGYLITFVLMCTGLFSEYKDPVTVKELMNENAQLLKVPSTILIKEAGSGLMPIVIGYSGVGTLPMPILDTRRIKKLEVNDSTVKVDSFELCLVQAGTPTRVKNKGAELSVESLALLARCKIGNKIIFELIRVKEPSEKTLSTIPDLNLRVRP